MKPRAESSLTLPIQVMIIFVLTLLSLWSQGYHYGITFADHAFWLPIIKHFNNPGLYPADVFINSAKEAYIPFWQGIAYLVRIFPQEPLFFTLHFLIRFGILLMLWMTAKTLSGNDVAALISLSLLLTNKRFLAGYSLYPQALTHTGFAWLFFIASVMFYFKENYLLAFTLLGIGFNFNPPLGAQLLIYYGIFTLWEKDIWRSKKYLIGVIACLILFVPDIRFLLITRAQVDQELSLFFIKLAGYPFQNNSDSFFHSS